MREDLVADDYYDYSDDFDDYTLWFSEYGDIILDKMIMGWVGRCCVKVCHDYKVTLIHGVYVDEDYRGRGIATALIKRALEFGNYPFVLDCTRQHQSFYESMGFSLVRIWSNEENCFMIRPNKL